MVSWKAAGAGKRQRGAIHKLPSGSLRVRVYAGIDPVTGKKHHLTEVIPAGPRAEKLAEKARTRLLAQVDERRNPRTRAMENGWEVEVTAWRARHYPGHTLAVVIAREIPRGREVLVCRLLEPHKRDDSCHHNRTSRSHTRATRRYVADQSSAA